MRHRLFDQGGAAADVHLRSTSESSYLQVLPCENRGGPELPEACLLPFLTCMLISSSIASHLPPLLSEDIRSQRRPAGESILFHAFCGSQHRAACSIKQLPPTSRVCDQVPHKTKVRLRSLRQYCIEEKTQHQQPNTRRRDTSSAPPPNGHNLRIPCLSPFTPFTLCDSHLAAANTSADLPQPERREGKSQQRIALASGLNLCQARV